MKDHRPIGFPAGALIPKGGQMYCHVHENQIIGLARGPFWLITLDFEPVGYGEDEVNCSIICGWIPWPVRRVEGNVKADARFQVYVRSPVEKGLQFRSMVLTADPDQDASCLGHAFSAAPAEGLRPSSHGYATPDPGSDQGCWRRATRRLRASRPIPRIINRRSKLRSEQRLRPVLVIGRSEHSLRWVLLAGSDKDLSWHEVFESIEVSGQYGYPCARFAYCST
jgi:hypothetical protein